MDGTRYDTHMTYDRFDLLAKIDRSIELAADIDDSGGDNGMTMIYYMTVTQHDTDTVYHIHHTACIHPHTHRYTQKRIVNESSMYILLTSRDVLMS